MDEIDAQLKGAETDLNWSSDVLEYINKTYEMIKDMEQRLQQAKDNVTKMNGIMETWAESPLFVRKVETKVLGLLSLNDRKDRVKSRYDMITKNGEEIHQLIQQNAGFFKVNVRCVFSQDKYVEWLRVGLDESSNLRNFTILTSQMIRAHLI